MPKLANVEQKLRPYVFWGVELDENSVSDNVLGDCPFCGRDNKFSVNREDGRWRCYVCQEGSDKGGGNALTFLRLLWEKSDAASDDGAEALAKDRKLLWPDTLMHWGVCKSFLTGEWIAPGYTLRGGIGQLYKWVKDKASGRMRFLPTPGLPLWPFGPHDGKKKKTVYITEGNWDGMALWEALRSAKDAGGGLTMTANEQQSLLKDALVIAAPNCGSVGEPFRAWLPLFAEAKIKLLFDSDEQDRAGKRAGFEATKRAAKMLATGPGTKPESVEWMAWGPDGFDPKRPPGFDVRDFLCADDRGKPTQGPGDRVRRLEAMLKLLKEAPQEWQGRAAEPKRPKVEDLPCRSWRELTMAWHRALAWREDLGDALAVMLAVTLSTMQVGVQLFLQVVANAGSAKTVLCDGLLKSKYCHPLEQLTGFFSGWQANKEGGEDYSLISRINGKTLVTPEGDTVMSSPQFLQIMSQQRRIFDGTAGATYKTLKKDRRYTGLRTPWIMAGTPAIMETDQSRLGDRFLKVHIGDPSPDEEKEILRRVAWTAWRNVDAVSDGKPHTQTDSDLHRAQLLTGGYVNYLREHAVDLLQAVDSESADVERVFARCEDYGRLTAFLRARPSLNKRKDVEASKELPSRLTHQFVRLAKCLAAVLNKLEVDEKVLSVVRRVALDTSRGWTRELVKLLRSRGDEGGTAKAISIWTGHEENDVRSYMIFLRRIKVVKAVARDVSGQRAVVYKLTDEVKRLWMEVVEDAKAAS